MKSKHWSTWYRGTEAEWKALPLQERERIAYEATGCLVAWPTWHAPVDCLHGECTVKRGERKPVSLVNGALRYERESGWLRFCSRERYAVIARGIRRHYFSTGETDIWKCWPAIVYGAALE